MLWTDQQHDDYFVWLLAYCGLNFNYVLNGLKYMIIQFNSWACQNRHKPKAQSFKLGQLGTAILPFDIIPPTPLWTPTCTITASWRHNHNIFVRHIYWFIQSTISAQDYSGARSSLNRDASCVSVEVSQRDQAASDPLRPKAGQHPPDRGQRVRRDQDHWLWPLQGHGWGELQPRPRNGLDEPGGRHLLVSRVSIFFFCESKRIVFKHKPQMKCIHFCPL